MELFLFMDADDEYTDDFETNDKVEALAYGQEHHLKVQRVYYIEADSEIVADFTGE